MGNVLSDILGGKSAEDEKKANDALNSLVEVARLRHDSFLATVKAGKVDQTLIPIDKIINNQHILKCSVTMDGSAIGKEVGEVLGSFCKGDIVKGITELSTDVLNLIFGNFSANQSEYTGYLISVGANGGVFRIDTDYYAYQYNSSDLQAICKNVVTSSVIISSADTSQIDKNTLRVVISEVYGSLDLKVQQMFYDQIEQALADDKKSLHYKRLNGLTHPYKNPPPHVDASGRTRTGSSAFLPDF